VDDLRNRLPGVHRRIQAILGAKYEERKELETRLEARTSERARLEKELTALTDRIETLARERDRLAEGVRRALESKPEYPDLVEAVEQRKNRHEQSERRYAAAVEEREEKTPEYEGNRLFRYLLDRRYGTADYRAWGLTRRLDAWVAGKVDFPRQWQNFRLLQEVPRVVERELTSSKQDLESHQGRLRAVEKEIEDLHGLTSIVHQGNELYEERAALIRRIRETDLRLESRAARLEELESGRGRYYEEARTEIAGFLEARSVQQLRGLAASTPGTKDDLLAQSLERWDAELIATRETAEAVRQDEQTTAARLDELRKLENRFRGKDYDASNSTFAQRFDLEALLSGFLGGVLSSRALWRAIVRDQRFQRTLYEDLGPILGDILHEVSRGSSGGGRTFGRGRGRRTSGGWGGGRSRTTGGFGGFGGGSRTTGGFG
jgi:chromosome segregation ATPase